MKDSYSKIIEELNSYYEAKELPRGVIKLCEYETVYDINKMVKTHLSIINNKSMSIKSKIPYIERLIKLKKILEE